MDRISRCLNKCEIILALVSSGFCFILMLAVCAEIVGRRLGYPIPGVVEFAILDLGIIVFLALGFTQYNRGHVRVDIFIKKLKGRVREIVEAVALLLGLIAIAVMCWQAVLVGIEAWSVGEYAPGIVRFPVWPGKILVSVGLFFLALRVVVQIIEHMIHAFRTSKAELVKE